MRKPRGDEQRFAHWKANKLCLTCNAKTKSCDCDLENAHVLLAEHSRRSGRTHYGSESGRSRYNIERKGEGVIALERLTLRGGAGDPARDCKVQSGVPCRKSGQARCKCNTCTTHSSCFYVKTKIRSESLASNSPGCRCQATTFSKSPATQQACCPISFHRPQGAEWSPTLSMISTAAYKTASTSKQAWTTPHASQCLTISPASMWHPNIIIMDEAQTPLPTLTVRPSNE